MVDLGSDALSEQLLRRERDYQLERLRAEPRVSPFHSDPRFADLAKRVGLSQ
jgi:hypothetical protein